MSNICCTLFVLLICLYHEAASNETVECNPPCENGGTCLSNGTCSCTYDFKGNTCQFRKTLCSVSKNELSSSLNCDDFSTGTTCFISCDETGNDAKRYNCTMDGHWRPRLPPCVQNFCFDNDYRCGDGHCVQNSHICDREHDCNDESDEKHCFYKDTEYVFFSEEKVGTYHQEGIKIYKAIVTTGTGADLPIPLPLNQIEAIVTGLTFDAKTETLFVSHADKPEIYSVHIESLRVKELVKTGIGFPVDIAFDWTSNNLYWIDSSNGTAEVISVDMLRRSIILSGLSRPVSLALLPESGIMFIADAAGSSYGIFRFEMDGRNRRTLYIVEEAPASLALHPSQTLLYWTDTRQGTISYGNYSNSNPYSVLRKGLGGIMSLTVNEDGIFYTTEQNEISLQVHRLRIGGYQKDRKWKSLASSFTFPKTYFPGNYSYKCLKENGGCDYLCLTNKVGRSCACSSEKILDIDGTSCIDKN